MIRTPELFPSLLSLVPYMHSPAPNVLGIFPEPDRELSVNVIARCLLRIHANHDELTWKKLAKRLDVHPDTLASAVKGASLLGFDVIARSLVTYIKNAREVRRRVIEEYPGCRISLRRIIALRAAFERPGFNERGRGRVSQDRNGPPIVGAGWHADMRRASTALLKAIEREHPAIVMRLKERAR